MLHVTRQKKWALTQTDDGLKTAGLADNMPNPMVGLFTHRGETPVPPATIDFSVPGPGVYEFCFYRNEDSPPVDKLARLYGASNGQLTVIDTNHQVAIQALERNNRTGIHFSDTAQAEIKDVFPELQMAENHAFAVTARHIFSFNAKPAASFKPLPLEHQQVKILARETNPGLTPENKLFAAVYGFSEISGVPGVHEITIYHKQGTGGAGLGKIFYASTNQNSHLAETAEAAIQGARTYTPFNERSGVELVLGTTISPGAKERVLTLFPELVSPANSRG